MGQDCSSTIAALARAQDHAAPGDEPRSLSLPDASTLLRYKAQASINRLMAVYLANLEEIADEHEEAMQKLMDVLPTEHKALVYLADVFGEARFEAIRKHVLDAGNGQRRDLEEAIQWALPLATNP